MNPWSKLLYFSTLLLDAIIISAALRLPSKSFLHSSPPVPTWPESYSLTYIFTLPYTGEIQPVPVSYDVTLYRRGGDVTTHKVRMETLEGANVMIASHTEEYELVPRLDKQVCRVFRDMETGESIASITGIPDVDGWTFRGGGHFVSRKLANGKEQEVETVLWEYEQKHQGKVVNYKFYLLEPKSWADTSDGSASTYYEPIRLHMHGNDLFSGAHFDEWIVDYTNFDATPPDDDLFKPPDAIKGTTCSQVPPDMLTTKTTEDTDYNNNKGISSARYRMESLVPRVVYRGHDAEYDAFLSGPHGSQRRHASLLEYHRRRKIFSTNLRIIQEHNKKEEKSFTMAINRFADWSRREFEQIMLSKKNRPTLALEAEKIESTRSRTLAKHEYAYNPLHSIYQLPTSLDWRGTGAVSPVKDQANCGSCWAFGSVGALEIAHYMATGESFVFSEQQVMDCAWGYAPDDTKNSACDGGEHWTGVGHVVEAGGVALLNEYPYLGQGDYCREKKYAGDKAVKMVGRFKGYARIPRYNDSALMEAIFSRGPIAVSLDASQDSFTFYSSGIYYDTNCMYKSEDLDHSMMAVGFGTDEAGRDYWIIKNSWSTNWGDKGYFKLARDGGGCGASTDAIYALVNDDKVDNA